jgi:hypothetical protein
MATQRARWVGLTTKDLLGFVQATMADPDSAEGSVSRVSAPADEDSGRPTRD